jgi:hypothetical protein
MNDQNQSEVARLLEQFRLEQEAAQRALHGFAQVGKHETITAHMERMGQIQEELKQLVGENDAGRLIVQAMEKASDKPAE